MDGLAIKGWNVALYATEPGSSPPRVSPRSATEAASRPPEKNPAFTDPAYMALKARIRSSNLPLREKKALLARLVQIVTKVSDLKKRKEALQLLQAEITMKEHEEEKRRRKTDVRSAAYEKQELDRYAETLEEDEEVRSPVSG